MRAYSTRREAVLARAMVLILVLALTPHPAVSSGAAAQEAMGWVAVQIHECPSGMTAASLDPWNCWVVTDGVEAQLWATDGTPLLGAADAYFDGWTWTWQPASAPVAVRRTPGSRRAGRPGSLARRDGASPSGRGQERAVDPALDAFGGRHLVPGDPLAFDGAGDDRRLVAAGEGGEDGSPQRGLDAQVQ